MSTPRTFRISPEAAKAVVKSLRVYQHAVEHHGELATVRWGTKPGTPEWIDARRDDELAFIEANGRAHDAIARLVDNLVRPAFAAAGLDLDALVRADDSDASVLVALAASVQLTRKPEGDHGLPPVRAERIDAETVSRVARHFGVGAK